MNDNIPPKTALEWAAEVEELRRKLEIQTRKEEELKKFSKIFLPNKNAKK
jgi:hypothetical protein